MKGFYDRLLGCLVFVLAICLLYPTNVRAQTTYRVYGWVYVGDLGRLLSNAHEVILYDEDTTQIDWTCTICKKDATYEFFVEPGTYYLKVDMGVFGLSGPGAIWQGGLYEVMVTNKNVRIHLRARNNIGWCTSMDWPCTDCPCCPPCE